MEDKEILKKIVDLSEIKDSIVTLKDNLYSDIDFKTIESLSQKYFSSGEVFGFLQEGLQGLIAFYDNDSVRKQAFLSMLVVDSSIQQQGIGQTLLNEMLHQCKKKGIVNVNLEVNINNQKALRFYQKNGFSICEKKNNMYVMIKVL